MTPVRRTSGHDEDVLAYIDQATLLSARATGREQTVQFVWVCERPIDMEAVERFHENFGHGLAGRLIELSALPFGRHRWVAATGRSEPLDVSDPRAPGELGAWIDERSQRPVDPINGPAWHLGVLPMTDGSAAITLVISHCVLDGGAAIRSVAEAVNGRRRDLPYRPPGSRTRFRALRSDARQTLRDLPELGRTVVTAVRFALRRRGEISASAASRSTSAPDVQGTVVLPSLSALVDVTDWDARATELGGTGYALLAAFSARLGQRIGRVGPSGGGVGLLIAVSDRGGDDDLRANAMKIANAEVDPTGSTTDLTATRAAVRTALAEVRDVPDETHALLPVTPFVPRRAVRRTADVVFGGLPVACSNVGEVPGDIQRIDGTAADFVMFRPADQNVSRSSLERSGGHLAVAAGRVGGRLSIGVVGYQVAAPNTREWLAEHVVAALDDFDVKATII